MHIYIYIYIYIYKIKNCFNNIFYLKNMRTFVSCCTFVIFFYLYLYVSYTYIYKCNMLTLSTKFSFYLFTW